MKKQGGFIPGIRPGKPTTDYLNRYFELYCFYRGCWPYHCRCHSDSSLTEYLDATVSFGGTSLIIIVGVVLETIKQIESSDAGS